MSHDFSPARMCFMFPRPVNGGRGTILSACLLGISPGVYTNPIVGLTPFVESKTRIQTNPYIKPSRIQKQACIQLSPRYLPEIAHSFLFLWHWVPNITWAAPNESVRTQVLQQAIPNVEELINHRWRHRRISNKAIPLMHKKKAGDDDQDIEAPEIVTKEEGTGGFGKWRAGDVSVESKLSPAPRNLSSAITEGDAMDFWSLEGMMLWSLS
ncbi:hypothetical protein NC653_020491 [Populus alba x Populus x berolinensis]|uniref:Uncharacterized protein n=1 Tax=Populus alba x Populus x berolinensis TaxID=444605 RepID=A0AAD6QCN3_9ROSI|nr:hypothetical protein NC653_020491 [Populus alba x Populus x berolinensis]